MCQACLDDNRVPVLTMCCCASCRVVSKVNRPSPCADHTPSTAPCMPCSITAGVSPTCTLTKRLSNRPLSFSTRRASPPPTTPSSTNSCTCTHSHESISKYDLNSNPHSKGVLAPLPGSRYTRRARRCPDGRRSAAARPVPAHCPAAHSPSLELPRQTQHPHQCLRTNHRFTSSAERCQRDENTLAAWLVGDVETTCQLYGGCCVT